MVFVSATSPSPPSGSSNPSIITSPLPKIHRSTSAILTSPSFQKENGIAGPPSLSLAFLHKKRHSDSSIIEETPFTSITSSPSIDDHESLSPPKLIRKKSGELVKSSLKLNCLQNQSRSMPTTPTYKNVHFGQDVDVRYFDEKDKPTAVSANTSPILKSMSKRWSRSKIGSGARFNLPGNFRGNNIDDYISTEDDDDDTDDSYISDDEEYETEVMWDMKHVNFQKIKYNEKFNQKSKIFLERLTLDDKNPNENIVGYIAVKNLSYHKEIHVRYTFDNWRTVIEIESQFTKESSRILKRSNYDRFIFQIPLKTFQFLNKNELKLNFCIRYRYDGEEIWDNNDYRNYEVLLTKTVRKRVNKKSKFILNDYFNQDHHSTFNESAIISSTKHSNPIQIPSSLSNDLERVPIPPNYNITSSPYPLKDIDSYFNNYEGFRSPETPRVLKTNDENVIGTPDFNDLNNFNNPLGSRSDVDCDITNIENVSDSIHKISLLSGDSNVNLMDYGKDGNTKIPSIVTSSSPNKDKTDSSMPSYNKPGNHKLTNKKPPMNSKSYQELLDSYCFFKGDEPTTISTYLDDSLGTR